jgi:hypothetical protein
MSLHRISASTALPPAFTARERAALDRYFSRTTAAHSAKATRRVAIALATAAISIDLIFNVLAPAHAEGLPAQAISASASFSAGAIVQVYKYDGSVQCGGPGITLTKMAHQLTHRGVRVIAIRKGTDGLLHPYICGVPDGIINVFEIDARGLSEAEARGFNPLTAPAH